MKIDVIGIQDCPYCTRAKWLSEVPGSTSTYTLVTRATKNKVVALIGQDFDTYPVVLVDNEYIGGCAELEQLILGGTNE